MRIGETFCSCGEFSRARGRAAVVSACGVKGADNAGVFTAEGKGASKVPPTVLPKVSTWFMLDSAESLVWVRVGSVSVVPGIMVPMMPARSVMRALTVETPGCDVVRSCGCSEVNCVSAVLSIMMAASKFS